MTNTTNSTSDEGYPTEWKLIDFLPDHVDSNGIECRQTSDDTFQLRSDTHVLTISKEGFNLFRDADNSEKWNKWLYDNKVKSTPRSTDG